jgi:hypothetical protein
VPAGAGVAISTDAAGDAPVFQQNGAASALKAFFIKVII